MANTSKPANKYRVRVMHRFSDIERIDCANAEEVAQALSRFDPDMKNIIEIAIVNLEALENG